MLEAVGTIIKHDSGQFTARLEVGVPYPAKFEAGPRKRMKDAITECNFVAEKLNWIMREPWARK